MYFELINVIFKLKWTNMKSTQAFYFYLPDLSLSYPNRTDKSKYVNIFSPVK